MILSDTIQKFKAAMKFVFKRKHWIVIDLSPEEMHKVRTGKNFTADIYIDGEKAASIHNSGHGGMSFVTAYRGSEELVKQAEQFTSKIVHFEMGGENVYHTLDSYADEIACKYDNERRLKASVNRWQKKNIVYGNPETGEIYTTGWKIPIEQVRVHSRHKLIDAIRETINGLKEGQKILNTNIDEELAIINQK